MKLERYAELLEARRSRADDPPLRQMVRQLFTGRFLAYVIGGGAVVLALWVLFMVAVGQLFTAMGPTP
jgi:hypothetical protein